MLRSLLLLALIGSINSFAQLTITESDFPDGNDTAMVSISTDFEFDFTTTGADVIWNYEALTMSSQRIDTFFNVGDASITYQVVFNNWIFDPEYQATYYQPQLDFAIPSTDIIGISIENPVSFTKVESDKVEIVGVGLEIEGIEVPIKNEIIDVAYELPMNYNDSWVSNSFFEIDLNPGYDGILRRYQERTTEVDGWGTVNTPFGSFEALRTRAVLDFTDSLRINIGGTPVWIEVPTPTQVIYSWWAEDQKIPVLEVLAQEAGGTETVASVEYKDRYLGDVGISEEINTAFQLFPNPASTLVTINADAPITALAVYSVDGQLVKTFGANAVINELDVSELASGTYVLKFMLANKPQSAQLIIE